MPSIEVKVLADTIDSEGKWQQTVVLTIQSGGTLADASMLVYGDVNHVEEIFQAARQKNPGLASPAQVPVGQVIELQIDPATSFIQQAVHKTDDVLERQFTNGVREVRYLRPQNSVVREIVFPKREGIASFVYPDASGPITAVPGGRVVDLQYRPPDTYEDLVRLAIGEATFQAANDFSKQTGWDPTQWPPPTGDVKRGIFRQVESYQPRPEHSVGPVNDLPEAQQKLQELIQARERAGIWAIRREALGIVYRVAIEDPNVTAKDVARLLYGTEEGYVRIAQLAGFPQPTGPSAESFNPRLFGRTFEILVEYPDERFVLDERPMEDGVGKVIRYLNGMVVEQHQDMRLGQPGLQQVVRYPTGFVRVLYRPTELVLSAADAVALVQIGGQTDPDQVEEARRAFAAGLIWQFAPGVPREIGTTMEYLEIRAAPGGRVVDALVAPTPSRPIETLLSANPCLNVVALVMLGSLLVLVIGIARRRDVVRA